MVTRIIISLVFGAVLTLFLLWVSNYLAKDIRQTQLAQAILNCHAPQGYICHRNKDDTVTPRAIRYKHYYLSTHKAEENKDRARTDCR